MKILVHNLIVSFFLPTILVAYADEKCNCYMIGTVESVDGLSVCSPFNFHCTCLPNVQGLNCDKCEAGFYDILSCQGCTDCLCDPTGALPNTLCDSKGKCKCKEGFGGYRCDVQETGQINLPNKEKCFCEELVSEYITNYRNELHEIGHMIENIDELNYNGLDLEAFERKLRELQRLIHKLRYEASEEVKIVVDSNIRSLVREVHRIKKEIFKIIANIPKNIRVAVDENGIYEIQNLIFMCKNQLIAASELSNTLNVHNGEISKIAQNAIKLAQKLESLPFLIDDVVHSYDTALRNIQTLEEYLMLLKDFYEHATQIYQPLRKKLANLLKKAQRTKASAIENRNLLDNLWFPFYNATKCYYNLSAEESFHLPENIEERLLKTKLLQNNVNNKNSQMENLKNRLNEAVRTNNKDVKLMEIIYKQYLKLVDNLLNNFDFNVEVLSETNESDRKIIQNELNNLIHKLEQFSDQLLELEKLNQRNYDFLQKIKKNLNNSTDNIDVLVELEIFFDALPLHNEQLDEIEVEIRKGEKYFQLLEEKNRLEKEVENVEKIAKELEGLGDPRDLCDKGVHPEGKNNSNPLQV